MCDEYECAALIILLTALKRKKERKKLRQRLRQKLTADSIRMQLKCLEYRSKSEYKTYLRMGPHAFKNLLYRIYPNILGKNTLLIKNLKPSHRLLLTLRFLTTGKSYTDLQNETGISVQTIARVVMETCEAIILNLDDCIKLPKSEEEWKALAKVFSDKWNFPNCLGAVDGRHIGLVKPPESGSIYYNSHKFFSIVLMAAVNANHEFIMVDVGSAGGMAETDLCKNFLDKLQSTQMNLPAPDYLPDSHTEKMPYVFVADEAFPLLEFNMKPFRLTAYSKSESIFNYRLTRARRTVTNVMGMLASRFKVLLTTLNMSPQKVATVALACCYLHNFLIQRKEKLYYSGGFDRENRATAELRQADWHHERGLACLTPNTTGDTCPRSIKVRNSFCKYFNNDGKVPWQDLN